MNKLAPRMATEITPGCVLRPVVALDLDGTLFDWHSDFLEFAHNWLFGRRKPGRQGWFQYKGGQLNHHMGITVEQYRAVKLAYRQSGLKRDLMAFPGAQNLVQAVRNAGAEVWACTTRPYLRLDNIDPDTREMLERNDIDVDGVIYGERKYRDLVELVDIERVVGVLDDLPEMVIQARSKGLNAMLIQRQHNQEWWAGNEPEKLAYVPPALPTLAAARDWLVAELNDWKAKHNVI